MSYNVPQCELVAGESRLFDFDQTANLADGETLDTVTSFTVSPAAGSTTPALVVGGPSASGSRVQVRISDGKAGTSFRFSGIVTTSEGNKLAVEGVLKVI